MKKFKFRIATWEQSEKFIQEIAHELESQIEHWDAKQVIINENVEIHFFPDDRGFGYITCKLFDESLYPLLQKYQNQYEEKKQD